MTHMLRASRRAARARRMTATRTPSGPASLSEAPLPNVLSITSANPEGAFMVDELAQAFVAGRGVPAAMTRPAPSRRSGEALA